MTVAFKLVIVMIVRSFYNIIVILNIKFFLLYDTGIAVALTIVVELCCVYSLRSIISKVLINNNYLILRTNAA